MAKIYQQAPSLNGIDATDDALSPLLIQAEFDSTVDSLATVQAIPNVFELGCPLLDIANGTTYKNIGTVAVPVFSIVDVSAVNAPSATIATTGNTDVYVIAPKGGKLQGIDFSGIDALAANNTNYITFSATNLGQSGAGSTAMLAATDANTTKATGGTAIAANTKRALTVNGTAANLVVAAGDRIRIRAAATGTLANTVTGGVYMLRFI